MPYPYRKYRLKESLRIPSKIRDSVNQTGHKSEISSILTASSDLNISTNNLQERKKVAIRSNSSEDEEEIVLRDDLTDENNIIPTTNWSLSEDKQDQFVKRKMLFPEKLIELLCSSETDKTIISWDAQGTSFMIHDPLRFSKEILPVAFRTKTYSSFTRQLKLYKFIRVLLPTMKMKRAYKHVLFLKAQPELCKNIKRIKVDNKIKESIYVSQDDPLQKKQDENEPKQEIKINKSKVLKRKAVDSLENSFLQKGGIITSTNEGHNQMQELIQNSSHHMQEQDRLHMYNLNVESHIALRRQRIIESYAQLIERHKALSISPKTDLSTVLNRSLHSMPCSVPLNIHASPFPSNQQLLQYFLNNPKV